MGEGKVAVDAGRQPRRRIGTSAAGLLCVVSSIRREPGSRCEEESLRRCKNGSETDMLRNKDGRDKKLSGQARGCEGGEATLVEVNHSKRWASQASLFRYFIFKSWVAVILSLGRAAWAGLGFVGAVQRCMSGLYSGRYSVVYPDTPAGAGIWVLRWGSLDMGAGWILDCLQAPVGASNTVVIVEDQPATLCGHVMIKQFGAEDSANQCYSLPTRYQKQGRIVPDRTPMTPSGKLAAL